MSLEEKKLHWTRLFYTYIINGNAEVCGNVVPGFSETNQHLTVGRIHPPTVGIKIIMSLLLYLTRV